MVISFKEFMDRREAQMVKNPAITPLGDKVVVQVEEAESRTAGGLIIPDTAKEKPLRGQVISVGSGRIDDNGNKIPMEVSSGDTVIVPKYTGTEVTIEDTVYLVIAEKDILAVLV